MFECSFKFSEEDNVIGTLYTIQKQPQKSFKFLRWFLPILLALNIGLLVWDIIDSESIALDVVLIILVVACMVITYMMPALHKSIAKKTYQKNLADKDAIDVSMDENRCSVAFIKNGEEVLKEVMNWTELTDFVEDETRIVLIFNNKFVVLRKQYLRGEIDLLRMLLQKYAKNRQ